MRKPDWARRRNATPAILARCKAVKNPSNTLRMRSHPDHKVAYWHVYFGVRDGAKRFLIYKPLNNHRRSMDKATLKAVAPYLWSTTFLFHRPGEKRLFIGTIIRPTWKNWRDMRRGWKGEAPKAKPRWRAIWRFTFRRRKSRKPFPFQPDVWFLHFPFGGTIVLPACVIPPRWRKMRLPRYSPGFWPWKFWERWDILDTLPDLPADLVWQDNEPTCPAVQPEASATPDPPCDASDSTPPCPPPATPWAASPP